MNLLTTTELVRLPRVYSNYAQNRQMADAIQKVVQQQRSHIQIHNDNRPIYFAFFTFSLALAVLLAILAQPVNVTINRHTKRLTIQQCPIYGNRTLVYSFDQIADVIVQKHLSHNGAMGRLAIVLKNRTIIMVDGHSCYPTVQAESMTTLMKSFLCLEC